MRNAIPIYNFKVINRDIQPDSLRLILELITDHDFNGKNGQEYYVNGVSKLDAALKECEGMSSSQIIQHIIKTNYSESCYNGLIYNVVELENDIVISFFVNFVG